MQRPRVQCSAVNLLLDVFNSIPLALTFLHGTILGGWTRAVVAIF